MKTVQKIFTLLILPIAFTVNAVNNIAPQLSSLHTCVEKGTLKDLETYLANTKDFDINAKDREGNTVLYKAVLNNDIEKVDALIRYKADINAINYFSNTPLHIATLMGNVEITKLLLAKGANPNAQNKTLDTPLHQAAKRWHSIKLSNRYSYDFSNKYTLNDLLAIVTADSDKKTLEQHAQDKFLIVHLLIGYSANTLCKNKAKETADVDAMTPKIALLITQTPVAHMAQKSITPEMPPKPVQTTKHHQIAKSYDKLPVQKKSWRFHGKNSNKIIPDFNSNLLERLRHNKSLSYLQAIGIIAGGTVLSIALLASNRDTLPQVRSFFQTMERKFFQFRNIPLFQSHLLLSNG